MRHLFLFSLVILLAVCQPSLAGPKRGGGGKRVKCQYDVTRGDCDPTTKRMTITKAPKEGQPETCETKTMEKRCRPKLDCQFQRPTISPCVEGKRTVTRQPTEGSDPGCEAKSRTRDCRAKAPKCTFGPWGEFGDCVEGVKTKTRPIQTGDQGACAAKATKTKRCKN
ncbi:uncharacterized protein LOC118406745 [Branchiostoma floridae]|nr:uncharacterized protein LOC118406745 [Branchiostoma floridae]